MPIVRTFTRSRSAKSQPLGEDCFLSGGYIPDSFLLENPQMGDQEHATSVPLRQTACFAVFSGIGKPAEALLAAQTAAEMLRAEIPRMLLLPLKDVESLLSRFQNQLARRLRELGRNSSGLADTNVAMALVALRGDQALIQVVNGCCAFVTRNGSSRPIGHLAGIFQLHEGDRLLISSPGLCPAIDETIVNTCLKHTEIRHGVDQLITLASERGRRSSLTCMILEWSAKDRERPDTPRMDKQPPAPPNPEREPPPPPPEKTPYDPWAHFPVWVAYFGLVLAIAVGLVIYFGLLRVKN